MSRTPARLVLVHWDAAAVHRAASLEAAGHTLELVQPQGRVALGQLAARPPDAVVIDLGRRPATGLAVAVHLRQRRATRRVPLVFAGGVRDALAAARRVLPDVTYTSWSQVRGAVRRALTQPVSAPVVPGTMDVYAGAPLLRKLGLQVGSRFVLHGAPRGFEARLRPLPGAPGRRVRGPRTWSWARSRRPGRPPPV